MKKMIIAVGISMLFILTAFASVGAVNINVTKNKISNPVPNDKFTITITVHVFMDTDGDGQQGPDEYKVQDAKTKCICDYPFYFMFIPAKVKKTDVNGDAKFYIFKNVEHFVLYAYTGMKWNQHNTWNYAKSFSSIKEDTTINLPLHYRE